MANHTLHVFSVGQEAMKKIAAHLHREYSEVGDWSSPEQLFSNFMRNLAEETGDAANFSLKDEEFVEGEIRFVVECSVEVATKAMEVLKTEESGQVEDQGA